MREPILNEEEAGRVIEASLHGHGPASTEEMRPVIDWATRAKVDAELFRLVQRGDVWLSHGPHGVIFVLADHLKGEKR
jgi:hypothetical protein